ncbi:MAG TPA: type II secretion system protein [Phycisphaerae bacterium]|nr:type II secretion system protein [Phycisphaerae bacterium]
MRRRGAMLLEVLVSIGILVFGMAVVGTQISSALQTARSVNIDTQAMMLADTLLAELAGGMIRMDINDDEIKGNFLNQAPGFTWRIGIERSSSDNLYMLTVEIAYNDGQVQAQIEDPLSDTSIEDEGAKIVHTLYRLFPTPADIDMERDYGLTPADVKQLMSGGGPKKSDAGEEGVGDGSQGGAADLAELASQLGIDLTLIMPLLEGGSFNPRDLSKLPEDQYMQIMQLLQAIFTQGGDALKEFQGADGQEKLKDAIESGEQP